MAGRYFFRLNRNFLPLSGGTVTGDTYINASLSANTFYSGNTNLEDIFLTAADVSGSTVSEGTNISVIQSGVDYNVSTVDSPAFNNALISGNTSASTVFVDTKIEPTTDNTVDLGTPFRRFRSLRTVNGVSTNFTATTRVSTPEILLGSTTVTENNIVLTGHCVDGGDW